MASTTLTKVQHALGEYGFTCYYHIVWNKDLLVLGRGDYHWKHESCLYMVRNGKKHNWQGARDQTTVWDIPVINSFARKGDEELVGHGNQKPLECMARPIRNNSAPGEIIYDPFVGSGTTIIAAENLARQCRAIEISPAYTAVCLERYRQAFNIEPELIG